MKGLRSLFMALRRHGDPGSVVIPPTPAPVNKYRFQQPLLFQRAHVLKEVFSYVDPVSGLTKTRPQLDTYFTYVDGSVGMSYESTSCGTDFTSLCKVSAWAWAVYGGDWLDNNPTVRVQNGPVAWVAPAVTPFPNTPAGVVNINVKNLIEYCDANSKWYAFYCKPTGGGQISITGPLDTHGYAQSTLEIVRDGILEVHNLWYACSMISSSASDAQNDVITAHNGRPFVFEFFRPVNQTGVITSATIKLQHRGTQFGSSMTLPLFLVNPVLPDLTSPLPGIAASYPLDAGLITHPSIAAALCVTDSMTEEDVLDIPFFQDYNNNTAWDGGPSVSWQREDNWDPSLWGVPGVDAWMMGVTEPTPARLATMFPQRVVTPEFTKVTGFSTIPEPESGKNNTIRFLTGADITARGFPVLAPGLGALEMTYPEVPNAPSGTGVRNDITTGDDVDLGGPTGRGSNDLNLHFKREHSGSVSDGYCRAYIMLAEGWEPGEVGTEFKWNWHVDTAAQMGKYPEEVGLTAYDVPWRSTDFQGKFPMGMQQQALLTRIRMYNPPTQESGSFVSTGNFNGYSNSSSPWGYQGRCIFSQGFFKAGHPGPAVGGARIGIELYDFSGNPANQVPNPQVPGFGSSTDGDPNWVADAAMSHMYQGKWYCVEMRWKLNTLITPYVKPPVGTHFLADSAVDGFIEWWVDGIYGGRTAMFATRSATKVDWQLQIGIGKPFAADPNWFRMRTKVTEADYAGFATMIMQTYYGGRAACTKDMILFMNGMVASNATYIGPMAGVSRANGGLGELEAPAPAWYTAIAPGTWGVISTTSLVASTADWTGADPGTGPSAGKSIVDIMNAWCGAVIVTAGVYEGATLIPGDHMVFSAGGGHAGWVGNETYSFGPIFSDTPTWRRLRDPTIPAPENIDQDASGNPVSRHTYNTMQYVPSLNSIVNFGIIGGGYSPNHAGPTTHRFNLGQATPNSVQPWSKLADFSPVGSSGYECTVFDPATNRIWGRPYAANAVGYYDVATNAYTWVGGKSPPWSLAQDATSALDTARGLWATWSYSGTASSLAFFNIASTANNYYVPSQSTGRPSANAGIIYDPVDDRFVVWAGAGKTLNFFKAPVANPLQGGDPWTWTSETPTTGSTPDAQNSNGTFSRFAYIERGSLRGYVLVNRVNSPIYFYRPASAV